MHNIKKLLIMPLMLLVSMCGMSQQTGKATYYAKYMHNHKTASGSRLNNYGYEMQYFRCPCGEYSEQALETVQKCGYKTVFWSFAYVDWKTDAQPSAAEGLDKLTKSAHGGEILLLHSVSATNAEILGDVIDGFREKGYIV